MERQQQIKKLLIILVVIGLFALSYYYYTAREPKKPVIVVNKTVQTVGHVNAAQTTQVTAISTAESATKTVVSTEQKPVLAEEEPVSPVSEKIKPSDKSSLISAAIGSTGKSDPFASGRSNFVSSRSGASLSSLPSLNLPGLDELPPPPDFAGANPEKQQTSAEDRVLIKGFFGNKVIAEINGITDSLAAGDKLGGVKVLSVDPANLGSKFLIDGKAVTKKLPPIVGPQDNTGLKATAQVKQGVATPCSNPDVNLPLLEN